MKKISSILMISMLAVATLFTSCTKDDENEDKTPSLNFKGGNEYVSTNKTIQVGEEITVAWTAISNATTSKKLSHFKAIIVEIGQEDYIIEEKDLNESSYTTEDKAISFSYPGVFDIKATVTDNANETKSVSITITVEEAEEPGVEVNKYSNIYLGSYQNATYGSFFASTTGTVYKMAAAAQNSSIIDMIFFKGLTNNFAIAAPSNESFGTGAGQISALNVHTWGTRNTTEFFKTNITASEFDAIGSEYAFPEHGTTDDIASNLQIGDVYMFITHTGKQGLFKVIDLGTDLRTIEEGKFDFIVEK